MKLHLPKSLFVAVLAACACNWQASALQAEDITERDVTVNTSDTYAGVNYNYSNGVLTFGNNKPSALTLTFTLDYDQFAALTADAYILYVAAKEDTTAKWGYKSDVEGDRAFAGKWKDGTHNTGATRMTDTDFAGYATGSGDNRVVEDLKATLQSGSPGANLTTADGETVFYCSGLTSSSKTLLSATFNTNLVTSFVIHDLCTETKRYSNASKAWSKSFKNDEVTNVTGNEQLILTGGESGSAAANTNPIVVGGAGQLKLEAWDEGNINLDDDIYMGSSTYTSDSINSAAAEYGVIRISNDDTEKHYSTTLSGKLYLVEDSSIKGTGSEAINITNLITDKALPTDTKPVDGDYTLTIGGAGINITAKVDIGGLAFVQGYDSDQNSFAGSAVLNSSDAQVDRLSVGENTTLEISGNLAVGSTVQNTGSIKLNGVNMTFEDIDPMLYSSNAQFYNKVPEAVNRSTSTNGYAEYSEIVLIGGSVSMTGENTLTAEGMQSWENRDGVGIVGTLEETVKDTSRFYVNSGTVRLSSSVASSDGIIYSDNTATTYVVGSGATLDAYFNKTNGKFGNDYALVGKTIELHEGATLTNAGGNADDNWQQLKEVVLKGDATLEATSGNSYGFLAQGYGESILNLNSHTLTKTGDGEFELLNTTVSNGAINVTGGQLVVASKTANFANGTTFNNATVNVGEDGTLVIKSMKDAATVASLLTSTTGAGSIRLEYGDSNTVINATAPGVQITGTLDIAKGQLYVGNANNQDSGADANFAASTVIIRNGATLWTHFGQGRLDNGNSKQLAANVYLESGAGFKNKDGCITWSGNVHFNVSNPDAETLSYNADGTVYLYTYWDKFIKLSGLVEGSGRVEFSSDSKGKNSYLSLTGSNNTFNGTYAVTSNHDAGQGNYILLDSATAAQNATIELSGNNSYLKLNQSSTIKGLNSTNANTAVTTGAAATLTVSEGSFAGVLQDGGNGKALSLNKTGEKDLTLSGANTYTGGTTVTAGRLVAQGDAALGNGNVTIQGGSVQIEHENATLTVEKMSAETNAEIQKSGAYTHTGGDNIKFIAAKVTISSAEALSTTNQLKNGSGLINNGAGTVTALNGFNNLAHIEARKGDINLNWVRYQGEVSTLIIEEGRTVGAYTTEQAINARQSMASLTVNGSATFAKNSTLNANLTLKSGTSVTLNGALDMGGSLTLESGLTLQGLKLDELGKLAPGSGEVILFSGVDTLVMAGTEYNVGEEVLTAANGVKLSDYFKNDSIGDQYYIGFNEHGDVYAGLIVPEPATATLSLLALAGLCARRRRASR